MAKMLRALCVAVGVLGAVAVQAQEVVKVNYTPPTINLQKLLGTTPKNMTPIPDQTAWICYTPWGTCWVAYYGFCTCCFYGAGCVSGTT